MLNLFEGLETETKRCSKCMEDLPLHNFGKASGASYIRGECKSCARKITTSRNIAKKKAPPIPKNHVCPICLRNEEQVKNRGGKKSGNWCCDHDHITGEFRGWLCHDCNRGIGNLGDDYDRVTRAANYINKNGKNI